MRLPLFVVLSLSIVAPARALTESTYESVALNSLRLAPPGLARIADKNRDQLVAGARTPLATEGGAEHLAEPRGTIAETIEAQTKRIVKLINDRTPFSQIVFELGVLSHYVADLNNPLNTAHADPRYERIRKDFESYIDRSRPKFLLTFDGHRSPELAKNDIKGFAAAVAGHSGKMAPYLSQSYFPGGAMVSSRTFDDRHTAFGVASVTYQNAIGDCARLYVYIWRQVNGDLRGTPFYGTEKAKAAEKWKGPR